MAEERDYVVTWEINIIAASPREAAERAEEYMRRYGSRNFDVTECGGEMVSLDLDDEGEACRSCGAAVDGGEGYDGECGSCADVTADLTAAEVYGA